MTENNWDAGDLTQRLCHALNIAEQAVDRLGLTGYTDPQDQRNSTRAEKIISETAVLLLAASSVSGDAQLRRRCERLAQLLIPRARSGRMLLGICLEPAVALDYALAHVCLTRLGYADPGVDKLLRQSRKALAKAGRERVPHRVLEQKWVATLWMNSGQALSQENPATISSSALNQPMDLLSGSRDDVYAFTHALMYQTDFGLCPERLPRPKKMILAEAEAALGRCLDSEDYDLAGEVLLAWPYTGKSWSAAGTFGFRILAQVEDQVGFLPAPSTRLQRVNELQGTDRIDYLLATAYHTVYVMGLLCAAVLRAGAAPPRTITAKPAATPGSGNNLLRLLDRDNQKAHWRDQIEDMSDTERDAIAPLLLSIALHRKIKQRDFACVHQLLSSAYAWGLADSLVAGQAAEMLERLATFATIMKKEDSGNENSRKEAQKAQKKAS